MSCVNAEGRGRNVSEATKPEAFPNIEHCLCWLENSSEAETFEATIATIDKARAELEAARELLAEVRKRRDVRAHTPRFDEFVCNCWMCKCIRRCEQEGL